MEGVQSNDGLEAFKNFAWIMSDGCADYGRFTGEKAYDPNSNQILPEFLLTGYEVLDKNPGWLFSPSDKYNSKSLSLIP